jgi:hypothetical protein
VLGSPPVSLFSRGSSSAKRMSMSAIVSLIVFDVSVVACDVILRAAIRDVSWLKKR